MYIERISIKSFGKVRNYECDFCKGINVIEGPNEAGKSTICAFLKFVFFGLSPKTDGLAVSERKKYQSWEDDSACGFAECDCSGKKYRIERSIIPALKGAGRETVKVTDLASGEECLQNEDLGMYFFGVNGEVFAQTAYIRQTDGNGVNGDTVNRAIENMLFSGDETVDTEIARENLDKARGYLLYRNKKGGVVYEMTSQKDKLSAKTDEARAANEKSFELCAGLDGLTVKKNMLTGECGSLKAVLDGCEAARVLDRFALLDSLEAKYNECVKAADDYTASKTTGTFFPDEQYVKGLYALAGEIELFTGELERAVSDKAALGGDKTDEADIGLLSKVEGDGGLAGIKKKFRDNERASKSSLTLGIFFTVFAVLWGGLAAACMLVPSLSVIMLAGFTLAQVGIGVAGVASVFIILAAVLYVRSHCASKRSDKIIEDYAATGEEDICDKINAAEGRARSQKIYIEKLIEADKKCKRITDELDFRKKRAEEELSRRNEVFTTAAELNESSKNAAEAIKRRRELESAAELARTEYEAVRASMSTYNRSAVAATVSAGGAGSSMNREQEGAAVEKYGELCDRLTEVNERITELRVSLASIEGTTADTDKLLDMYDELSAKTKKLEEKHDALELAIKVLDQASADLRAQVSPRLSMQASIYMRKATADKYESVSVSPGMGIEVGTNEGGVAFTSRELDYMSEGTKDAAYVSLRLALIGMLYRKELPPLVFDEAFARLDDKRLSGMFSVIRSYSENNGQIFVVTSQKRDAEIMRRNSDFKYVKLGV